MARSVSRPVIFQETTTSTFICRLPHPHPGVPHLKKTSKYLRIYGKTLRELAQERGQSIYKTWSQIQDENGK